MKVSYKSGGVGTANIKKGLAVLNGSDVLVGIPEGPTRRGKLLDAAANMEMNPDGTTTKKALKMATDAAKQSPITNAELMFIHTNGSPARGIPARPVIEPAIEQKSTADAIAKQLSGACAAALSGDTAEMAKRLNRAGVIGEAASKQWFTNPANNWAPNAPSSIAAKGSDTPLIDTGALRRSITHVVELSSAGGNSSGRDSDTGAGEEVQQAVGDVAGMGEEAMAGFGEVAELVAL